MMLRRTPLKRSSWLRAKPAKPKRQRDTGPDQDTEDLVKKRAHYGCERCGRCRGQVIHHRDPRGAGGSSRPEVNAASNLVLLCNDCHLRVERKRLEAIGDGFLIPDGQEMHPLTTPVRLWHGTYYLTDSGELTPHKDNAEEAS